MNIKEFIVKIKNQEIDIVEHTGKILEECRKISHEYNYLNTISEELALQQAKEIKDGLKRNDKKINTSTIRSK